MGESNRTFFSLQSHKESISGSGDCLQDIPLISFDFLLSRSHKRIQKFGRVVVSLWTWSGYERSRSPRRTRSQVVRFGTTYKAPTEREAKL